MELTDEQIELLIDHSDGHWREDTFRIDGPSLTALLRAAAKAASADVSRDSILEEAAKVCEAKFQDHYDHSQRKGGAQECADAIRSLKRQSNSERQP